MTEAALAKLDSARRALMESRDLGEIIAIRDVAEQARMAARAARMGLEAENYAAEVKIRAERRAGELIETMPKNRGGQPRTDCKLQSVPTYRELEIEPTQAHRWQRVASVPEPIFEQHITNVLADGQRRLTSQSVIKVAKDLERQQPPKDAPTNAVPDGLYPTLIADPPWKYSNVATRAAAEDHYPTLSIPELCALEVNGKHISQWAAEQAHLYLWTTNGFLREAFDIMDNWGFDYKTALVWVKPQLGIGNYFRSSHEYVLFGVKGGLKVKQSNERSWFQVERGRHSRKPDYFYDLVERVSPGPYLELFARTDMFGPRDGWTPWGNQA